jgi:hypothetical protein
LEELFENKKETVHRRFPLKTPQGFLHSQIESSTENIDSRSYIPTVKRKLAKGQQA